MKVSTEYPLAAEPSLHLAQETTPTAPARRASSAGSISTAHEHSPSQEQWQVAQERLTVVRAVERLRDVGLSLARAIDLVRLEMDAAPCPATIRNWMAAANKGGAAALAPKHRGRVRKDYGWEARAVELWSSPNRPAAATVARWLAAEGYDSATPSRVRAYLKSLPATCGGENAPQRAGWHWYQQNVTPSAVRTAAHVPVGAIYEGDGHTCDVYVAHPATGKPWRPELTVWIDVRSHYVVGWHLSEAESAASTMYALANALRLHGHVPSAIHVDPGSGFVNHAMDEYLGRLSIERLCARPGAAREKGLVEGWFRWMEERCGKKWETYCGASRTDDVLRRLAANLRSGQLRLPSVDDYAASLAEYIDEYNRTPQERLGASPAELWAQLERVPVEIPDAALVRPRVARKVRRGTVEFYGRLYRAGSELLNWEGREVGVEYDLTNDERVWILDGGHLVTEATLVQRRRWVPESRVEQLQQQRLAGQRQRLARKLAEAEQRSRGPVTAEAAVNGFDAIAATPAIEQKKGSCLDWRDALPGMEDAGQ